MMFIEGGWMYFLAGFGVTLAVCVIIIAILFLLTKDDPQ